MCASPLSSTNTISRLFCRFLHSLATKFEFDIEICAEP